MASEFEQEVGEKTEEPTQHRIDEFRKRGEVASSKELTGVLVLSVSVLTLMVSTMFIYETIDEFIRWVYSLDAATAFSKKSFRLIVVETSWTIIKCLAPMLIATVVVVFISNIMQIGFLFSPEVLSWKAERINPFMGLKRICSMQSVAEVLKGIFKFLFIILIVWIFLKDNIGYFRGFFHVDFVNTFIVGKAIILKLTFFLIGALFLVAVADLAYQKIRYQNKLRMTKEQAKRDQKEHDGSPEVKQRIRSIQRDMSTRRMMEELKTADVVITNPTHLSVALKYDEKKMVSPKVIAKGADHLAMRIRKVAKEHDIPLVENVPLARAIYETVKLNAPIPRVLYNAVAEVLSFVYKLKRNKKKPSVGVGV